VTSGAKALAEGGITSTGRSSAIMPVARFSYAPDALLGDFGTGAPSLKTAETPD
jgi:hypothetical protein